jgi:putative nucleotidyltransferase with HDIG domain
MFDEESMDPTASLSPQSLFSQKLDRAVLLSYFLGAVVPLAALGLVATRYALPTLENAPYERATLLSVVVAVVVLTLASYLALRRLSHSALKRMDDDNARLASLVMASRALGGAAHPQAVAQATTSSALDLTGGSAAYLLRRAGPGKGMSVYESSGDDAQAIYAESEDALRELIEAALRDGRPVSGRSAGGKPCASLAVPIVQEADSESVLVICDLTSRPHFEAEQIDAIATLARLSAGALQTADLQDLQRNFFAHVTDILVAALDAFVDGRVGHAEKVARNVNQLGRELGLDDEQLRRLHFAALLHDIGMLRVDRKGHSDPKQFMKHPRLGHKMMSRIRLWQNAAPSILHHHEWYDGSGYPDGLARDAIPLDARIIAVADAFDAMVRPKGEGGGLSFELALAELRNGAGTQFDPEVVTAFARLAAAGQISIE